MAASSLTVRVVVEYASRRLVARLARALEESEMEGTSALLGERLAARQGFETVIRHGCVRLALRPFAELLVLEIAEIAERQGLLTSTREQLARQAMVDAGYA